MLNHGWDNIRLGVEAEKALGRENAQRVLDALLRLGGRRMAIPTHDVRAATRRQGVALSRITVWRHLRALEVEGKVIQEPGTGRGARPLLWRIAASELDPKQARP